MPLFSSSKTHPTATTHHTHHTHTTGTGIGTTSGGGGGLLSRLRSGNRPATYQKPVYTTSGTRTTKPGIFKKNKRSTLGSGTTTTGGGLLGGHRKKGGLVGGQPIGTTGTTGKPTMGQKIHGAATVVSGKMHNDHREVRIGEKEMEGKVPSTGLLRHKRV